jgi:chromosome segregation ATPase
MLTRLVLLCAVVVLSAGCALRRVPLKVLEQLPYEAKIELLEAENDLALAVDRLDEARAEVNRARDQIRRGRDRYSAARDEVGAAADENSKAVAELAVIEADKRVEWLRAKQKVNVREEDLAEQNLRCAEARYEVARLAAARKAKLEGSETLDPETFEAQLKSCEDDYAAQKEKAKEVGAEAETMRADWDQARAALAKKTFDARASPFVE